MKKAAKALIVAILSRHVLRLRKKHDFKVVAVVGSIGKTSTKTAIAEVLSESMRVQYQKGNYNDLVSVPLIFFGQDMPSLTNPFAWMKVFLKNASQIRKNYPYDVVVVELGTDGPGQIAAFKKYIQADVAVVTALTPEHMEYFSGIEAVAEEELSVASFSKKLLINTDLCPGELIQSYSGTFLSYGLEKDATYKSTQVEFGQEGARFDVLKDRSPWLTLQNDSFSEVQIYTLTAAAAVADMLGQSAEAVVSGIAKVKPVAGRMQRLRGIKNATIIDDSYNASPDAVKASLRTLLRMPASQKIALLGNMNELGALAEEAHREVGELCQPASLQLVVTLGKDANASLAAAAEKNGCKVVRTNSPYEAGKVIAEALEKGAAVLVKGSQNGVFSEEAIKALLADPADEARLVRQSPEWMSTKKRMFDGK